MVGGGLRVHIGAGVGRCGCVRRGRRVPRGVRLLALLRLDLFAWAGHGRDRRAGARARLIRRPSLLLRLVPRLPAAEQAPERAERRGDGAHERVALRLLVHVGVGCRRDALDRRPRKTQVGASRADARSRPERQKQRDQQ
jgi:hypothetical protein